MNQTITVFNLVVGGASMLALLASAMALFVTRFEHGDTTRRVSRLEEQYDDLRKGKGFIQE